MAVGVALFPSTFLSPVLADTAATALPTGGQVTSGSATLTYTPNKLQVDQSSNKAILQWDGFSIGSNAWVNFSQPSASAVALNRVTGTNPSEIFGRLTSNGQVFLTNPNGVLFAPSASVDVGGLFATTLSIADRDFLAGRYNFYNAGGAGSVTNQGVITATGYASLAGPQVRNDGIIIARAGTVALAGGDRVSLDMIGDGLIKVSVDQAALNASAINSGRIEADGGNVILTARSANALLDTVINNSGIVRANSLIEHNGQIVLDGGATGTVANSGTLQAAGAKAGTNGGSIKVLGDKVALLSGTRIDASGDTGGGTILAGGNLHGAGPEYNASKTTVASDVSINADAVTSGNGGTVIIWSDDATYFAGHISARGGLQSGDGGFAEVSGKNSLNLPRLAGHFDLRARAVGGHAGNLLLDPNSIDIDAGVADGTAAAGTPNTGAGASTVTASSGPTSILASDIEEVLAAGTSVTLRTTDSGATTDNININTALNGGVATAGAKLTFDADDFVTGFSNLTGTAGANYTVLLKIDLIGTVSKVYDATTTASLASGDYRAHGFIQGDSISSVTQTSGSYNTKDVGSGKLITSDGLTEGVDYTLTGTVANYTLPTSASGNVGVITPKTLAYSGLSVPLTKVYDATTAAVLSGTAALNAAQGPGTGSTADGNPYTGDVVSITGTAAGTYNTKDVAAANTVTFTGLTSSNANYTIAQTQTQAATITPAAVSFTGTRTYDATTNVAASIFGTSGSVATGIGTETVALTGVGTVASKDVLAGSQAVNTAGLALNDGTNGGLASNYTFSGGTQTASFTAKALTQTGLSVPGSKIYDATTAAVVSGTATLNAAQGPGTGTTVDGNPYTGDVVSITGTAAGTYNTKDVATANTVSFTGTSLTGGDAGNYTLTAHASQAATITPKALTQTGLTVPGSKTYDATTAAVVSGTATLSAAQGPGTGTTADGNPYTGDVLSIAGTAAGTYNTKDVSTANTVSFTGTSLTGGDAGNYTLTAHASQAATITPAAVSFTGTRTYDATTTFNANTFGASGIINSGIAGETLLLTGAGSVPSSHVAAGVQAVNTAGLALNNGTGLAGNYTFAGGTQTGTVSTTTVSLVASRAYDGSPNFIAGAFTPTFIGTVGGETLTIASGTGSVPSKDVSAGTQPLTIGTLALGNGTGTASDYTLGGTHTGTISRLASVTWTGAGGNSLWSNAANWTGGAIPDKNNVQNVNLAGATVTFDNSVPALSGSVQVDNVSAGALAVNSGTLNVASAAALTGYSQSGGTTMTGTTFGSTGGYAQSAGLTQVGTNLSLSGGAVNQTGGSLTVGGTSSINAGASGIALASGSNDFGGSVSLTGAATQIGDSNSLTLAALSTGALTAVSASGLNLGSGTVNGNLTASTNGTISETGALIVSGASNLQAGAGAISLTAPNTFTGAVTANAASITMTAANTLTPGTISSGAGQINLTANGFGTTGSVSGGSGRFSSANDVGGSGNSLNIHFGFGSVVLTGSASSWNLSGPATPQPTFTPSSQSTGANVFYNNGCISGPACAGVFSVTASIGASVSQIAAQALKDAQSTDSVAKQIDYGFAGDVGTTPPMDHRIDETGISTPPCFEESREGAACK